MSENKFKLKDRIKSFKFALNGIKLLIINEHNARIHLAASIIVLFACFALNLKSMEVTIIIMCIGLVFITEIINTAIERLADFVEPEWNAKIGIIKDYSAGAVLIAAVISSLIGTIIFLPKLIEMF